MILMIWILYPFSLPGEIWKPVENFEGSFSVSNLGRVLSHKRLVPPTGPHQKTKTVRTRVLKNLLGNKGYYRVQISGRKYLVHRLVAQAFVHNPEKEKYNVVNHLDGNKINNLPSNLEWVSHKLNNEHAFQTFLIGSNMPVVCENLNTREKIFFISKSRLIKALSIGDRTLEKCLNSKKTWKNYKFRYATEREKKNYTKRFLNDNKKVRKKLSKLR